MAERLHGNDPYIQVSALCDASLGEDFEGKGDRSGKHCGKGSELEPNAHDFLGLVDSRLFLYYLYNILNDSHLMHGRLNREHPLAGHSEQRRTIKKITLQVAFSKGPSRPGTVLISSVSKGGVTRGDGLSSKNCSPAHPGR